MNIASGFILFLVALPGIAVAIVLTWLRSWSTSSKLTLSFTIAIALGHFLACFARSDGSALCRRWRMWWRRSREDVFLSRARSRLLRMRSENYRWRSTGLLTSLQINACARSKRRPF